MTKLHCSCTAGIFCLFYGFLFFWVFFLPEWGVGLCFMAWRILVPSPGIEPATPAVEEQSLKNWTTRKVPAQVFFFFFFFFNKLNREEITSQKGNVGNGMCLHLSVEEQCEFFNHLFVSLFAWFGFLAERKQSFYPTRYLQNYCWSLQNMSPCFQFSPLHPSLHAATYKFNLHVSLNSIKAAPGQKPPSSPLANWMKHSQPHLAGQGSHIMAPSP